MGEEDEEDEEEEVSGKSRRGKQHGDAQQRDTVRADNSCRSCRMLAVSR